MILELQEGTCVIGTELLRFALPPLECTYLPYLGKNNGKVYRPPRPELASTLESETVAQEFQVDRLAALQGVPGIIAKVI
jgi:hypothetical protein